METEQILSVVTKINAEGYNKFEDNFFTLTFKSDGTASIIEYLGTTIWSSEDDDRNFNDNLGYEPLELYIKTKINKLLENLQSQKLKI